MRVNDFELHPEDKGVLDKLHQELGETTDMALKKITDPVTDIDSRFGVAQDPEKPDDIQHRLDVQLIIRERIHQAADSINREVEESRESSIALTKLEEALMWAGKAIFKEED